MLEGVLAYIGIGSNLGDSPQICKNAIRHLSHVPDVKLERVSSLYKTEPVIDSPADSYNIEELKDQNRFINAVAEIRTGLPARSLLELLMRIEMQPNRACLSKCVDYAQPRPHPQADVFSSAHLTKRAMNRCMLQCKQTGETRLPHVPKENAHALLGRLSGFL